VVAADKSGWSDTISHLHKFMNIFNSKLQDTKQTIRSLSREKEVFAIDENRNENRVEDNVKKELTKTKDLLQSDTYCLGLKISEDQC
jgi:hypothetical protein